MQRDSVTATARRTLCPYLHAHTYMPARTSTRAKPSIWRDGVRVPVPTMSAPEGPKGQSSSRSRREDDERAYARTGRREGHTDESPQFR